MYELYCMLDKYINCAKFNWCEMWYDNDLESIKIYDREEHKIIGLTRLLNFIFDNGMLNEIYTKDELTRLKDLLPVKFAKEIDYYV